MGYNDTDWLTSPKWRHFFSRIKEKFSSVIVTIWKQLSFVFFRNYKFEFSKNIETFHFSPWEAELDFWKIKPNGKKN